MFFLAETSLRLSWVRATLWLVEAASSVGTSVAEANVEVVRPSPLPVVSGKGRWPRLIVQCAVLPYGGRIVVENIGIEELACLVEAILCRVLLIVCSCMMSEPNMILIALIRTLRGASSSALANVENSRKSFNTHVGVFLVTIRWRVDC